MQDFSHISAPDKILLYNWVFSCALDMVLSWNHFSQCEERDLCHNCNTVESMQHNIQLQSKQLYLCLGHSERTGATRLFLIATSECAFLLWKIRCERLLDDNKETRNITPAPQEVRNRLIATLNER